MPLVRFEVKNEYGLGDPVLYRSKKDCDPKAILDGVAVAGLVGILRQLGDLAELASDIFHDLHEQVMATSARGCKLSTRIQHLDTELPLLENAIWGQMSPLHFAYVAGSDWHADLQLKESHILSSDLPRFMTDSYEECRDPPRLYLLDRFDTAGTGVCLRRYSDPSYFKRVWAMSELEKSEKVQREKKAQKIKRKGSQIKNGEGQESASLSRQYSSSRFAYPSTDERIFSTEATPISAMKLKPSIASRSLSFGSRTRLNDVEQVHHTISSGSQDEVEDDGLSASNLKINQRDSFASDIHDKENGTTYSSSPHSSLKEDSAYRSPSVTWDEKTEILKPTSPIPRNDILVDNTQYSEPRPVSSEQSSDMEPETSAIGTLNQGSSTMNAPTQSFSINHLVEITGETDNYMDALNTLESEMETDSECQTKCELKSSSNSSYQQATSGTSQMPKMASLSSDLATDGKAGGSQSSNEDESPNAYNFIPSQSMESVKLPHVIGSIPDPEYSVGNQISSGDPFGMSNMDSFEADDEPFEPGISQMQEMASVSFDFNGADSPTGSQSSLNEGECKNAYSMPSKILGTMNPPHSIGFIPNPNDSIGNRKSEGNPFDMSRISSIEGVTHQTPESSLCNSSSVLEPKAFAIVTESPASAPVNITNVPSRKLWTNGGLLGLEPSKPPVFGISTSEDLVCDSNNSGYDHSSTLGETKLHGNVLAWDPDKVPSLNDVISRKSTFIMRTDELPSASFNQSCLDGQQFGRGDNVISKFDPFQNGCGVTVASGSELLGGNSVESQPNDSAQTTMDIASSISALAQRILANSLQRKQLFVHSQNGGVNPDDIQQEITVVIDNQKDLSTGVKSEACQAENTNNIKHVSTKSSILSSSHLSGNSSPPLEHMKISFHPMKDLETSRLKLEYATDNLHEGTEDVSFLSFQLLPGPNLSFENNGSETDDDDTFCRSCHYTSEDHFSPCSDSNSELWEQEDVSGENNHQMYNDLRRISLSSSSISSFKEFCQMSLNDPATGFENLEAENSILNIQIGNSVGHHGRDSLISTNGEGTCDSLSTDHEICASQSQNVLPPPTPLPPMQRRMMNAPTDKEEENSSVAKIVKHFNVLQVQRFTPHKQQEQNTPMSPSFPETLGSPIKKPQNQQSPYGKLESNHAAKRKGFDAKEELLHQFRKIHDGQKLNGHKHTRHDVDSKQLGGREELLHQIGNKHDIQKLNGLEQPKIPSPNGQEVDEREGLLLQIRNQAFNLRRTSAAKTSLVPQPTTNINVAAILEKANAIRQAFVGSDGGDDDNWSDG